MGFSMHAVSISAPVLKGRIPNGFLISGALVASVLGALLGNGWLLLLGMFLILLVAVVERIARPAVAVPSPRLRAVAPDGGVDARVARLRGMFDKG